MTTYIVDAMQESGVSCEPHFEVAFADGEIEIFSRVQPAQAPVSVQARQPVSQVNAVGPAAPVQALPAPVAELARLAAVQADTARRVNTRIDLVERLVAYLALATICALREEQGEEGLREALRAFLPTGKEASQPLTFGAWVTIARSLAGMCSSNSHPVFQAAKACVEEKSGPLQVVNRMVVPLRNKIKHGSNLPESSYREVEPELEAITRELLAAMHPLLELDPVCVDELEALPRGVFSCRFRVLRGQGSSFEVRQETLPWALIKGWAYLLIPERAPLRLAPGIWCEIDRATEEVNLFLCRSIALKEGEAVSIVSLRGQQHRKIRMPG